MPEDTSNLVAMAGLAMAVGAGAGAGADKDTKASLAAGEPTHRTVTATFLDASQSMCHNEDEDVLCIRFSDDLNAATIVAQVCEQCAVECPDFVAGLYKKLILTPAWRKSESLRFRLNATMQDAQKRSERLAQLLEVTEGQ